MESERATEIQQALIQNGYMTGEPSGVWDSQSASAMQKFQGDNGWQTKITPDSRALIKLGLGPQQDAMAHLRQPPVTHSGGLDAPDILKLVEYPSGPPPGAIA